MIIKKMSKFLISLFFSLALILTSTSAQADDFSAWLKNFKIVAKKEGISDSTIRELLSNVVYLDKVIVYDNRQPEFFEKTNVYISKRSTLRSLRNAKLKLKENYEILERVEKEFRVEKEILLALWSIETNFGRNLGKMDLVSSLATLSFDKRRSEFFTNQLLILLKLVDRNILSKDMLFGSWAGALGNFQFMPSTIINYGIDYDNDNKIDLKGSKYDAIASAANYINKIGWKYNTSCFKEVKFNKKINKTFFNHSARNIKNKKSIDFWKSKGVEIIGKKNSPNKKEIAALVLPDGDESSPKYLVFDNYEKILKWNRSLRFALTVCTLAEKIKNDI